MGNIRLEASSNTHGIFALGRHAAGAIVLGILELADNFFGVLFGFVGGPCGKKAEDRSVL